MNELTKDFEAHLDRRNYNNKEPLLLDKQKLLVKPKRITDVTFGMFKGPDAIRAGEIQVSSQRLYELDNNRTPVRNGSLDPRLGVSDKHAQCETCGKCLADCTGHFGYIQLELPVFHIGFFKALHDVLQSICKTCGRVLVQDPDRSKFLKLLSNKALDSVSKGAICKKVLEKCKKVRTCFYCGALNGSVKKVTGASALKLIHEKYKIKEYFNEPSSVKERDKKFKTAVKYNPDIENYIVRIPEPLNPKEALELLKKIPLADLPLLWLDPVHSQPESMILTHLLVPPVAIRPSVKMDVGAGSNEDDLTMKLREIINVNNALRDAISAGGKPTSIDQVLNVFLVGKVAMIAEAWDFLQVQVAQYINGELPGFPPTMRKEKPIRGLVQRLKGKQGRFRGNLSGKRVDFSARTVISPDPNLSVRQVGVPLTMAMRLTYPEVVNKNNIAQLQEMVRRGPYEHPGANYIRLKGKSKSVLPPLPQQQNSMVKTLAFGNRTKLSKDLRIGDVVERHLVDDDILLFNRQPSLHKMSIMCHRAKVLEGRTLRFNECVCSPYNADFDGDEMNLHVPQTEEARAEATSLMGVEHNLITPRNGEPIVAATQDFITASFLMTQREVFLDKDQFCQIVSTIGDCTEHLDLPPPAIIKPKLLWTGKQVWNVLLRPNTTSRWPKVNLETRERNFTSYSMYGPIMCPYEGYVVCRNSELLCGNLGKNVLGSSKTGLFYTLVRDHSEALAAEMMNRMTKVVTRWLTDFGFTIGIDDVTPSKELLIRKEEAIEQGYLECERNIKNFEKGTLTMRPGCNMEESLESEVSGILSNVRDILGTMCMQTLPRYNKPFIMATCGSKGSALNICQMIACVGQQIVGGKRMPNGFMRRTLPHFPLDAKDPNSKGFVANSFYSGLSAPEFFFHTMGGREGLVDTAVKTAETGYMARRLMKALEDLSVRYDGSVRNSAGGIVQFTYGDDSLNPAFMEQNDQPVDWNRMLRNILLSNPYADEKALTYHGIRNFAEKKLTLQSSTLNEILENNQSTLNDITLYHFLEEAKLFFETLAEKHEDCCEKIGVHIGSDNLYMRLSSKREREEHMSKLLKQYGNMDQWSKEASSKSTKAYEDCGFFLLNNAFRITEGHLKDLIQSAGKVYQRAIIEPGEAVGAIGAQSLGEPGTQMTLKTFHFAGVASMNVTLGVPRIKEIINASKTISTPIITVALDKEYDERVARIVKGRIESTTLGQITSYIEEVYLPDHVFLIVQLDMKTIESLDLEITPGSIVEAIAQSRLIKLPKENIIPIEEKNRIQIAVTCKPIQGKVVPSIPQDDFDTSFLSAFSTCVLKSSTMYLDTQKLKALICQIEVAGISTVHRAVVNIGEKREAKVETGNSYHLLVEGLGFLEVIGKPGVNGLKSTTNNIIELEGVLGIEAARRVIMDEVAYIFGRYGLSIDRRHLMLLADVMSYRGQVLGITRFGISKMKESVLMLASFEKTADHLFDAAVHARTDEINGVSECIIMGTPIPIGTGMFKVLSNWKRGKVEMKLKETFL